jgi:uncharacterized protein YidB (DUF937 family)
MGILDDLLGGLMNSSSTRAAPASGRAMLLQMVLQLMQQNGGLQGVLRRMQQSGYGPQIQSWIGTGQNLPIPPDVLSQIFGHGSLQEIAQQLGVSRQEAAGTLAQALPEVVDTMTPQGHIPADNDDLVAKTLEQLQRGKGA